jgi:hypothetical protein
MKQQVDKDHRICEHGRDAFAADCGMCEFAGTNNAAKAKANAQVEAVAWPFPDNYMDHKEISIDTVRQAYHDGYATARRIYAAPPPPSAERVREIAEEWAAAYEHNLIETITGAINEALEAK